MAALPLAARPATGADDDFFARSCNTRKAGPTLLPKNFIAVLAPALLVFEGRMLFLAATSLQEPPAASCPTLLRSLNPPNRVLPEGASGVNEKFRHRRQFALRHHDGTDEIQAKAARAAAGHIRYGIPVATPL